MPVSVRDVAAYILRKQGPMTHMKLQKLVYYCQAWALVWDGEPLFAEEIQAWANGPVVPDLYNCFRGQFEITPDAAIGGGSPDRLNNVSRETIDAVLSNYGDKTPVWLSSLTHQEEPWKDARGDLPPGARGSKAITHAAMAEFYGSL